MLCVITGAEGAVSLSGLVRNGLNGTPLNGAHVRIEGTNWISISGPDGSFAFSDLPSGEYKVTATHIGHEPQTTRLSIRSESPAIMYFQLQPVDIILPDVTVEYQQVSSIVFTSDQIKKSTAGNLAAFLNSTGEILIVDGGGSKNAEIVIRGAKSEQIAVYLDGFRLNDPRTGKVDLKEISLSSIDKIVIQSNSNLSEGASSPGGAVELYTSGFSGKSAGFETGSFGHRAFTLDAGKDIENQSFNFSFKRSISEGDFKYTDPDTKIEETRMNSDHSSDNFFLRYQNEISSTADFSLSFHRMSSQRGAPGSVQNPDSLDRINTVRNGLSANLNFHGNNWINQNRLHYYETDFENIDYFQWMGEYLDFASNHHTIALEADSRLTRADSAGFSTAGISYRNDRVASSTLANEEDRRDIGIFLQRSLRKSGFNISSTIRTDFYRDYGSLLSSSMNARYTPPLLSNRLTFSANWNQDYNLPTFNQLFWAENVFAAANPDLLPEKMNTYDIGAEWLQDGFSFRSVYFHRSIRDMIIWRESFTQSGKKWKPFNTDAALISGFELSANMKIQKFSINTSANISEPLNKSQGYEGNYLVFRPKVQTSESIIWKWNNIESGVHHRYMSRRYTLEANTKWEEPVSLFDLSFGYTHIMKTWKYNLNLRIENILDEEYEIINDSPMPARNYKAGLTINFN